MKITRRKLEAGVPAVAMADIAFNLVLFFIIMARAQDESHLKWDHASLPKIEKVDASHVSVTVVNKENDHKVYLNGMKVSISQLASAIGNLLGDAPAGKRTVLLKISKDTPAATFEPIIEAVSQAGGDVVHLLDEEKNE